MESLSNARRCKSEKELYQQAISDLALGHWLHTSQMALLKGAPPITKKMARKIMNEVANKVIGPSQIIFKA